jgi:hypothetical protein
MLMDWIAEDACIETDLAACRLAPRWFEWLAKRDFLADARRRWARRADRMRELVAEIAADVEQERQRVSLH